MTFTLRAPVRGTLKENERFFIRFSEPLVLSPRSGIMLGGDNILITGPSYKPSQHIVCDFPGGQPSNGSYMNDTRAYCTVPMLMVTGRLSIELSINGGKYFEFQGTFTSGTKTEFIFILDWVR